MAGTMESLTILGKEFCRSEPVDLRLGTAGCCGYQILDANGNPLFTAEGSLNVKKILDSNGNILMRLQHMCLSLCSKWKVYRGSEARNEELLFTVQRAFFRLPMRLKIYLQSDKEPQFICNGSWFHGSFKLYRGDTGALIAEAKRHWSLASLIGRAAYSVKVEPGVDYAFAVATFITAHEIQREWNANGGGG